MNTAKKLLQAVVAALSVSWLVSGCVRLSEPEHFVCNSNADCESGERCLGFECHDELYCQNSSDCAKDRHCSASACVPDECTDANAASKCHGFGCDYEGQCYSSCFFSDSECATGFVCVDRDCVQGAPPAKGTAGETCSSGTDCLSGFCCAQPGKVQSTCSAQACSALPACTSDVQCPFGQVCMGQKCVVPPPKAKEPGETCSLGTECSSGACADGKCRGMAGTGQSCQQDYNCTTGRKCCKQPLIQSLLCGDLDRGCSGTIGDKCEVDSDCVEGSCNDSFCTKPCANNAECGVSPWGVANACETNGLGDKICFPGCTTSSQCTQNIGFDLSCYDAFDSNARICSAE